MCSIGGWISNQPLDPKVSARLSTALVYYGSPRGQQSSGIWSAGHIVKRAMQPAKFIGIRAVDELLAKPSNLALTHTRQPTSGGTGDQQAQPFRLGNTITVHNGCISNDGVLKEKYRLTKASGVDSELFASFIDTHGITKLPEFLDDMVGSAAVACVSNNELYLIRKGNPLEYLFIDIGTEKVMIFASTEDQVLHTARSAYLIPPHTRTITVKWGSILRAEPTTVTTLHECPSYTTMVYPPITEYHGEKHPTWYERQEQERLASAASAAHGYRKKIKWDNKKQRFLDAKTGEDFIV